MYRLILAGGRDFSEYKTLVSSVVEFIKEHEIENKPIIISGGAAGADSLGEKFAENNNLSIEMYLADWGKYGRGAGHIRNKQMAKNADGCIVFWNGYSKGSKSMIKYAREKNLDLKIVRYN